MRRSGGKATPRSRPLRSPTRKWGAAENSTASIAVVGHATRLDTAQQLAVTVAADNLFIDSGELGAEGNHRRAWEWLHETPGEWAVVLEDDAQPCQSFRDQLDAALQHAPTPIVSLYLGTGYPPRWQQRIRSAVTGINTATCWLTADVLLHAVAVAARTDILPVVFDDGYAPDVAVSRWACRKGHRIAYSVPSLVDHADTTPVVTRRYDRLTRDKPRKAWMVGTRGTWTGRAKPL